MIPTNRRVPLPTDVFKIIKQYSKPNDITYVIATVYELDRATMDVTAKNVSIGKLCHDDPNAMFPNDEYYVRMSGAFLDSQHNPAIKPPGADYIKKLKKGMSKLPNIGAGEILDDNKLRREAPEALGLSEHVARAMRAEIERKVGMPANKAMAIVNDIEMVRTGPNNPWQPTKPITDEQFAVFESLGIPRDKVLEHLQKSCEEHGSLLRAQQKLS